MKWTPAELYPHGHPRIHAVAEFGDLATCIELDRLFARYASLENQAEAQGWPEEAMTSAKVAFDEYTFARQVANLDAIAVKLGKRIVVVDDWLAEQAAMNDLEATQHDASYRSQ